MKFLVIGGNAAGMSAASKAKRNDKDSEVTVLEKTWIPLALRANRAGWAVADNVCDGQTELDGVAGTAVFKVFDLEVARTGLTVAEAQQSGFDPAEMVIQSRLRAHSHPG